jgi:hypothetical protein
VDEDGSKLVLLGGYLRLRGWIATQILFASRLSRFLATLAELLVSEPLLDQNHRLIFQDLAVMTEKVGKWLDGAACESNLIARFVLVTDILYDVILITIAIVYCTF